MVTGRGRGPYQQLDELVSLFAVAKSSRRTDCDARTFVEALPNGWCYSALMPSGMRTVAFQTDSELVPRRYANTTWLWEQLSQGATIYSLLRRHEYEFAEPARIVPAHSGRFKYCSGSNWIAVGDAAMTFDPLSGQGTAKTLDSSYQAVRRILNQDDYEAVCNRMWGRFLQQRAEFYGAERRWANKEFWSRRHGIQM
jgi:hypothetical protein